MSTNALSREILNESLWQGIESHLEKEKKRIFYEILHYPPPIPACDVQFNFLLAERAEITQDLRRVREMFQSRQSGPQQAQAILEFIKSCKFIDNSLEAKLLADLNGVLDEQRSL